MRSICRAAAVGLLFAVTACGGSGGGGGGGGGGLSGLFLVASVGGRFTTAPEMEGGYGRATPDPATSTTAFDLGGNGEGTAFPPGVETLGTTLEADGTFRVLAPDMGGPTEFGRGARSDDGSVFVFGSVRAGTRPAFFTMIRAFGTTASAANLAGNYHVALLQHPAAQPVSGLVGQATFDGVSLGQIVPGATRNDEGAITTLIVPLALQYAVTADGTATLNALGFDFKGGLREGGDLLLVGGAVQNGGPPGMFAFVRAATTASLATFDGTYALVLLQYSGTTTAFTSHTGRAQADGAGTFSFESTKNEEGVIGPSAGGNSYTVGADGTLTIGSVRGAVSPDGRFAILGGTGANTSPAIYLLVRR